jgi:hypothetical protein
MSGSDIPDREALAKQAALYRFCRSCGAPTVLRAARGGFDPQTGREIASFYAICTIRANAKKDWREKLWPIMELRHPQFYIGQSFLGADDIVFMPDPGPEEDL